MKNRGSIATIWPAAAAALLCALLFARLILTTHLVATAAVTAGRVQTVELDRPDRPIRVVLISDTHVIGPQYVPGSESNPVDNESILKTPERLERVRAAVNGIVPAPDLAVFVGDVVHNALELSPHYEYYVTHRTALNIAADIFKGFDARVFFMWGNHDYRTTCGDWGASVSAHVCHRLFETFFASPAYQAVDVGPWRLLLLNSMLGASWDPDHARCNPKLASYGARQLQWLDEQLAAGRPTLVFLHFPLPIALREEGLPGAPDVLTVLSRYDNVRHVYSGHYHRGLEWGPLYRFPATTLPAVRYDEDNFFVMELAADGSTHRIVDWAKNRGGARCSDTWRYDGEPRTVPDAVEKGTCGEPTAAEGEGFRLPQVEHVADIPARFNPERSCWFPFAEQLLGSCMREGATTDCCSIMAEVFKPSSAAFFASCMCHPVFWQHMQRAFEAVGHNAIRVVEQCIGQYGALIQYFGQPHGSCPSEQSRRGVVIAASQAAMVAS